MTDKPKLPEKLDIERINTYPDPSEAMYAGVDIVNYELAIVSDKINAIISYLEEKEHGE